MTNNKQMEAEIKIKGLKKLARLIEQIEHERLAWLDVYKEYDKALKDYEAVLDKYIKATSGAPRTKLELTPWQRDKLEEWEKEQDEAMNNKAPDWTYVFHRGRLYTQSEVDDIIYRAIGGRPHQED